MAVITLQNLNNFMKNYSSGTIVPEKFAYDSFYDTIAPFVKKNAFQGDAIEQLIQTGFPHTAQAFGQNVAIPAAQGISYVKNWIPLKEMIVNAGITQQAMDMATGGGNSWGNAVDEALRAQREDWKDLMRIAAFGDGTGRLARCTGTNVHTTTADRMTICVDNTINDFGWDNAWLIKPGMYVEIFSANGTQYVDAGGVSAWQVTQTWYGDRNNGVAVTPVATAASETSAFEISIPDAYHAAADSALDDGAMVHLAGTRSLSLSDFAGTGAGSPARAYTSTMGAACYSSLPMGLVGLVQKSMASPTAAGKCYTDGTIDVTLDIFQGLTRATYPTLNANVFNGADFTGGALGTPVEWSLSAISDIMDQVENNTKRPTDILVMSSRLAMAVNRLNKSEGGMNVVIDNSSQTNQPAVGARYAEAFLRPDGKKIPIKVDATIPHNVMYGLNLEDVDMYTKGDHDFMRLYGDVWQPVMGSRYANFEAPFHGYTQVGAKRCDGAWVCQDLRYDIG